MCSIIKTVNFSVALIMFTNIVYILNNYLVSWFHLASVEILQERSSKFLLYLTSQHLISQPAEEQWKLRRELVSEIQSRLSRSKRLSLRERAESDGIGILLLTGAMC